MRFAVLLLFLSGVANAQAVRPPPRPAPSAPGAPSFIPEAPVRGPDFKPSLPPSPHKRRLPDTPERYREDGIWAGDAPKRARRAPELWGYALALPTEPEPAEMDRAWACESVIDGGIDRASAYEQVGHLPEDQRACLLARMYGQCLALGYQRAIDAGRVADVLAWWLRLRESAHEEVKRRCSGVESTDDMIRLNGGIAKHFVKIMAERTIQ